MTNDIQAVRCIYPKCRPLTVTETPPESTIFWWYADITGPLNVKVVCAVPTLLAIVTCCVSRRSDLASLVKHRIDDTDVHELVVHGADDIDAVAE